MVLHPLMTELATRPALSVLDLAIVRADGTSADALADTAALAQRAEALGYERFWVAEHHNMPSVASTTPPVLMAHLAAITKRIRIGSGGIMLPNHPPLVVAEHIAALEALHPGRIDLGIGRAPGTDQLTARALRRTATPFSEEEFPAQLVELLGYFTGQFPEGHPFRSITATPGLGYQPALWLLGSSDYGARVAGMLGLPFSFAHHFAAHNTLAAVRAYRESFHPSEVLAEPYVMIGVAVICAETDERAQWLAGPSPLSFVRRHTGRPGRIPTPEEAAAHEFTALELELLRPWTASLVVGAPDAVHAALDDLAARTGADELMLVTMLARHPERVRSYELVAHELGLEPRAG